MDREKVIKALSICVPETQDDSKLKCSDCPYGDVCNPNDIVGITLPLIWDIRALLKEQEALLHEYEKLSQVCFKIEKYFRIADLSILIDRIEEGKVEVLQYDGRPDAMETTIKIRRL